MKNPFIILSLTLLCLATTVVAENKIYDDPAKCDSGCAGADKYCTTGAGSDCVYRDATEYPCKDGSDCPVDYDCGNKTYETTTCVSNPAENEILGLIAFIFILILIGVLLYAKHK